METKKVLVIDDEKSILTVARISLANRFCTLVASSGATGVALAESEKPDVILLDLCMPGMNGIETLKVLKANELTAQIPVLLFTVAVLPDELESYRNLPVTGCIAKPFDPITLPSQITDMLNVGCALRVTA